MIIWPDNTKDIINGIRGVIGRDVIFNYVTSSYDCPLCHLDVATGTSDNSFCPVCSGTYYIDIISGVTISAFISWAGSELPEWQSGGTIPGGDATLQIEVTDEMEAILDKTRDILVDNRLMEIRKRLYRGVKNINRVLLSLIEKQDKS